MKISLCMIVGNVEAYIERCLGSFLPIADEVIIVRAIGNQKPDSTIEIAHRVCGPKLIVGEYLNKPGHEGWPHIDDFGAARQMSFDLASGEYCFWCDSDDMLESGADRVRELAQEAKWPAYIFPYKIFARGLSVPRERMMRRESGRWRFAVHECFDFKEKPVAGIEDQRVVVIHLPQTDKTGSNGRNLRILRSIPEPEMTTGLWYHLHVELALAGDVAGSVEAAQRALAAPDIGKPEKVEIYLNLALTTQDPTQRETLLKEAYISDPTRREGLALLAVNALNAGRWPEALAFARQMMGTVIPARIEWNHRAALYNWVGADIYAQALRVNGYGEEAERVRQLTLQHAGGARISLLHATRGRCEQAAAMRKLWLDLAEQPERIEHIFCLDADDAESEPLRRMHHVLVPAGGGCVRAWNAGAAASVAPVIVQMSDDFVPPQLWDRTILNRLGDTSKPAVLAVSDGLRTDELLTMGICTRKYMERDGWLFHPDFLGMFCDNWFTEQAYARGVVIEARDVIFRHEHPLKTGAAMDRTYAEHNSETRYRQGAEVLARLRKEAGR